MSLFKSLRAIALLPGTVTLVVPGLVLYFTRSVNVGGSLPRPWNLGPPLLGLALLGAGLGLMAWTIGLFTTAGQGTLAPWDPTRRLVVRGPYRHVRNPMIAGVFCVLLGEAVLLGSRPLFYWFVAVLLINVLYIPLVEEPGLKRRFGEDYILYKQNVPRWIPRRQPWTPPGEAPD